MATDTSDKSSHRSVFYLIGDSLIQDASAVVNGGWSALELSDSARRVNPVLITLCLGANDAALVNGPEGFLHVPVYPYHANLGRSITEFRQHAPQAKLHITPPVVDDDHRRRFQVEAGGPSEPLDRTNQQAAIYAAACADVAASFSDVALLDLHTYFSKQYPDATERGSFFADRLHFTKEGNRFVLEQVYAHIRRLLATASWQFPDIRDVAQLD